MTTACPNGHDSKWPDWCSTCGERIGPVEAAGGPTPTAPSPTPDVSAPDAGAAAASASGATGPPCDNCGVARHELDVFCESCGYDFASGSLPESQTPEPAAQAAAAASPMHAKVSVDAAFFAASVGEVELTLPDPLPAPEIVPLAGIRILIGRQSTSRGIFPEIDVRALTDDPAVSSRHAMLERDVDNNWTLTDLGSTNGTFLTAAADEPIEAGIALPIVGGSSFYIGDWTRISIADTAT